MNTPSDVLSAHERILPMRRFSTRPLRMASLLGMLMAAAGGVGVVVTIVAWLQGRTVAGWASVMVVMLGLGGIQLVVLGIIGEYLGRLYMEAKQRPPYVIDEIRGGGARG